LLPDLVGRGKVIGAVEIAVVDLLARHEFFDLERMGALDLDLLDLLILDLNILALADLVAAADVLPVDRLAGFRLDQLLLEPGARLLVDPVERNLLRARCRRIEGNRAGHERELQVALPIRTRGHGDSYTAAPIGAWVETSGTPRERSIAFTIKTLTTVIQLCSGRQ